MLNYQTIKIILTIFISSNSLFGLLGLSEDNQKSEKQTQKGKLNKIIKSLQKSLKNTAVIK